MAVFFQKLFRETSYNVVVKGKPIKIMEQYSRGNRVWRIYLLNKRYWIAILWLIDIKGVETVLKQFPTNIISLLLVLEKVEFGSGQCVHVEKLSQYFSISFLDTVYLADVFSGLPHNKLTSRERLQRQLREKEFAWWNNGCEWGVRRTLFSNNYFFYLSSSNFEWSSSLVDNCIYLDVYCQYGNFKRWKLENVLTSSVM